MKPRGNLTYGLDTGTGRQKPHQQPAGNQKHDRPGKEGIYSFHHYKKEETRDPNCQGIYIHRLYMLCSISNQVQHILGSVQVQSQQKPEQAESDNERSSGHKPIDYRPGQKDYDKAQTQQRKSDMDNN